MSDSRYDILSSIDFYIRPLLFRVLYVDKLGISWERFAADSVSSSCGQVEGDRFKLTIPYARYNVTWNVLFDSHCPEMGPDFEFNDNSFLADMDVDTLSEKVPGLAKWDPNDQDALVNVLLQLIACYKQHQIQLLPNQSRLSAEYDMLMKSKTVDPKDVEMILLPSSQKPTEARFLIGLSVDISGLNCGATRNEAMLAISYTGTDWSRITPKLQFSKFLEDAIDRKDTFYLPPFLSETCLMDYVQETRKRVQNNVNSVVERLTKRREYISTMLGFIGMSNLEYDAENYTYITLLQSEDDFSVVVHICIPLGFPKEAPKVVFQSIYHMVSPNEPFSEELETYPYIPSWPTCKMCVKLFQFLKENIKKFKKKSIEKFN